MDIEWLQDIFPNIFGDLGFIKEKIFLGNQIFGNDLIYMVSYRTVPLLIETLVPPRLDHSKIDWTSIFQRLTPAAQLRPNFASWIGAINSRGQQGPMMISLFCLIHKR